MVEEYMDVGLKLLFNLYFIYTMGWKLRKKSNQNKIRFKQIYSVYVHVGQ